MVQYTTNLRFQSFKSQTGYLFIGFESYLNNKNLSLKKIDKLPSRNWPGSNGWNKLQILLSFSHIMVTPYYSEIALYVSRLMNWIFQGGHTWSRGGLSMFLIPPHWPTNFSKKSPPQEKNFGAPFFQKLDGFWKVNGF